MLALLSRLCSEYCLKDCLVLAGAPVLEAGAGAGVQHAGQWERACTGGLEQVWEGGTDDRGGKCARTLIALGAIPPALRCWIPRNIPWALGDKSLSPSLDLGN